MTILGQLTKYVFGPRILRAAITGNLRKVEELIHGGVDINTTDASGLTPLMLATQSAHYEVVEFLLSHGAAVNAKTPGGFSAILHPCIQGDVAMLQLLIEAGANVNAAEDGNTPLMYGAINGNREIIELLLSNGADPEATDMNGLSADIFARAKGHNEIAELIKASAKQR